MGANCCVASRNKPSPVRNNCDVTNYRTVRLSPSWSFRWDNRTHIEDIMDNPSQLSNQHSGNVSSEIKSLADTENECISEGSSPFSIHAPRWRKKTGIAGSSKSLFADQSPRSNFSSEDKYSFKSSSSPIIAKPSMSFTSPSSSSSSFKAPEPLLPNPSSSSSKKARKHNNEQLSLEESHESWSMRTFSELVAASAMKESWPLFDAATPTSTSYSKSHQTCKICSKPMNEKSPWSAQKIVSTNELSTAAVLECGHVYHDECLENITLDVNRYDPPCPVVSIQLKMENENKTNVPYPPTENPPIPETKNIGSETQYPGPPTASLKQDEEDKKPEVQAATVPSSKFENQGQTQSQTESESKKRRLDKSIKELRSSTYFKIRSIICDLRPLFVQVIHAPDFHGCKAADDIQKQVRTLMELTKEFKYEAPQPKSYFCEQTSTETEQNNKRKVNQAFQKPSKNAKQNASKLKESKFQGNCVTGGSPVGWNFVFWHNQKNSAVYYGVTKEVFRARIHK